MGTWSHLEYFSYKSSHLLWKLPSCYMNDVTIIYSCNCFIYNFTALLPQGRLLANVMRPFLKFIFWDSGHLLWVFLHKMQMFDSKMGLQVLRRNRRQCKRRAGGAWLCEPCFFSARARWSSWENVKCFSEVPVCSRETWGQPLDIDTMRGDVKVRSHFSSFI